MPNQEPWGIPRHPKTSTHGHQEAVHDEEATIAVAPETFENENQVLGSGEQ